MFQQFYEPHPALKGFVNNIMIHQVKVGDMIDRRDFSIPPLPGHGLIFYVRDPVESQNASTHIKEKLPPSFIIGANINRHIVTPGKDHLVINVGFQPGGLYRFLGIAMSELVYKDGFDATDLPGNEIKQVHSRLQEATSFLQLKTIVEDFLLKRVDNIKQALPFDHALSLLMQEQGLLKIDQLASYACLSIRQFERVFQQRIGLTPKHFSRLVRFSQAWILKEQQPGISWIKIAHHCGYFDQMHLIRDFQEFAAVNPSVIEKEFRQSSVKLSNVAY